MIDVSIILPTRGRPQRLRACLFNLFTTFRDDMRPVIEVIVIVDRPDLDSAQQARDFPVKLHVMQADFTTAVQKWNIGYDDAKGQWAVLAADDLWFYPGWLEAALTSDHQGFVGLWDRHTPIDTFATHYMLRRDVINQHMGGYFIWPEYQSWYFDFEVKEVMQRNKIRYFVCAEALAEHLHPMYGLAELDDTYRGADAAHATDFEVFNRRAGLGFPMERVPAY